MRRTVLGGGAMALCLWLGSSVAQDPPAAYRSPYRVELRFSSNELVGDLDHTERGDPHFETDIAYSQWYTPRIRQQWGAWGPPTRHYLPPSDVRDWPVERNRERVIAVALRFLGYGYQHHHTPDWDPPAGWPWKETCPGRNGKGVDCSNFTGFVYNLGFGLRLNTDVVSQAEQRSVKETGTGREVAIREIPLPSTYGARIKTLRTGDLLFIRNNAGKISHVVLWVGSIGRSMGDVPLILDSTGGSVRDGEGHLIPCGIQLRPFAENSWYHHSASHALRIFVDP